MKSESEVNMPEIGMMRFPMGWVAVIAILFVFVIMSCVFYPIYNRGFNEGVEFIQQKLVKEGFAEYKHDENGKPFWALKDKESE